MHGFATRAYSSDSRVPIIWQPEFNRCATVFTEFKRAWGSAHDLNFKNLEKVFYTTFSTKSGKPLTFPIIALPLSTAATPSGVPE